MYNDHCDTRPPPDTNAARPGPRELTQLTNNWTYYADTVNTCISNTAINRLQNTGIVFQPDDGQLGKGRNM